jgi:hypothetical protein
VIKPTTEPFVYDDNTGAKAALEANQIDAAVFDLPTALFVTTEIDGSSVVGQFPASAGGTTDQFGFVLDKGSALTGCVERGDHHAHRLRRTRRDPAGMAVGHHRSTGHRGRLTGRRHPTDARP